MMTNLLSSSVARLRFLLVMLVTLTVSANVCGADVTINVASDTWTNTGTSNTGSTTKVSKSGVTVSSNKGYKDGTTAIREYSGGNITVSSNDNITKIVFTSTANKGSKYGPDCIALKSGSAGTYTTSSNSKLGTWTGTAKSITFTCSAQFRWTNIVVTIADAHTVTWTINPAAGGTLSATSGNTTTVTPNVAYTYGSPAYTVTPAGNANVSQDGDNFTATPSANCTIQINMVEKTHATITLFEAGQTSNPSGTFYVGDLYQLPATTSQTCGDKTFVGWSTVEIDNSAEKPTSNFHEPGASVTLGATNTFYAVFAETGGTPTTSWPETDIADINDGDEVVVVMTKTDNYALFDNNGTSSAPTATSINIANNHISDLPVGDELIWVIGKSNSELTFYQDKTKETWLYCTNTNNGVRVGTNENKTFTIDTSNGYLKNTGTSRYVGIYNSQDWRCYTSCTGNSNIAGQTLAFYKKTEKSSAQNYTTQCSNKPSLCLIQKEVAY